MKTLLTKILVPGIVALTMYLVLDLARWIMFSLGLFLGVWLVLVDHVLFIMYGDPNDPQVQAASWYVQQKKWSDALAFLLSADNQQQRRLLSRSVVFVAIFLVLSAYLVATSEGWFGLGFIAGWHLNMVGLWLSWWFRPSIFRDQVFWQVKWQPSDQQTHLFTVGYIVCLSLLLGSFLL